MPDEQPIEVSYLDSTGRYLSARLVKKHFKIPLVSIGRWRAKCPYPGVRVRSLHTRLPDAKSPVYLYHLDDVRKIARIRTGQNEEEEQQAGWLTAEQSESCGVCRDTLWRQIPAKLKRRLGKSANGRPGKRPTKCRWLLGRPIKTKVELLARGARMIQCRLFSGADVEQLAELMLSEAATVEKEGDRTWVSIGYIQEHYGIPRVTTGRWASRGCPHLPSQRRMRSKRARLPGERAFVLMLDYADVQLAVDARAGVRSGEMEPFLTAREVYAQKGITWQNLWRFWKHPHPVLGRPITSRRELRPTGKRMIWQRVFDPADLETISSHVSVESPAPPAGDRQPDVTTAPPPAPPTREPAAATADDRQLDAKEAPSEASPQTEWILVSKVWPERFKTYKQFTRFLRRHPEIHSRRVGKQRREIHAGDWTNYWAATTSKAFDSLDDESPLTAEYRRDSAHRQEQIREKKRAPDRDIQLPFLLPDTSEKSL